MASLSRPHKQTHRTVTNVAPASAELKGLRRQMKNVRSLKCARQIMREADSLGFDPDLYLWTGFLRVAAGEGWGIVSRVWNDMQSLLPNDLDSWAYSEFIKACAEYQKFAEAVNAIREMREAGILVDHITFNNLIFCATTTRQPWVVVDHIVDDMLDAGFDVTSKDTQFSLMNYYAEMRDLEQVERLFFNCLNQPYASDFDDINEMFGVALKCLSRLSPVPIELAERWFDAWKDFALVMSPVPWTTMMTIYVRAGELNNALDCFEQMCARGCQPNVVTYGVLMYIYEKQGSVEHAEELMWELKTNHIPIDSYIRGSYNRVTRRCT